MTITGLDLLICCGLTFGLGWFFGEVRGWGRSFRESSEMDRRLRGE